MVYAKELSYQYLSMTSQFPQLEDIRRSQIGESKKESGFVMLLGIYLVLYIQ